MQRQFVESLKRLYISGTIDAEKIIELCKNDKITEEENWYILDVKK